jgi:prepilin-type N-terminal cleavage/methylation domain-containing protein
MFRNNRGFTLIELVVVAAIIGILAAMGAVAYTKYSTRAKTRIAKTYLATAFMAERTFFAEHLSFTLCLRQIKGLPGDPMVGAGDLTVRYYFVGFSNFGAPTSCGKLSNQSCLLPSFSQVVPACSCGAMVPTGSNDCGADATIRSALTDTAGRVWSLNRTSFLIGASGFIGGNQADVWRIDQDKNLTMVQSGE